jgi:hypothetical protein
MVEFGCFAPRTTRYETFSLKEEQGSQSYRLSYFGFFCLVPLCQWIEPDYT